MTTVGIHQPNYFPWLGFFDKIAKSDVFVMLDDVQFQKTGGNWTNRVRMLSPKGASWETVPVDRSGSGFRRVNEVAFKDYEEWRSKFLRSVSHRYGGFPFVLETMEMIEEIVELPTRHLADFNLRAIKKLCETVGIEFQIKLSSSFSLRSSSTSRLCEIVKSVGGDTYLIGSGSAGYVDMEVFERNGVRVLPQRFSHPSYLQIGRQEFVEGLSIIDTLMCIGRSGVGKFIRA